MGKPLPMELRPRVVDFVEEVTRIELRRRSSGFAPPPGSGRSNHRTLKKWCSLAGRSGADIQRQRQIVMAAGSRLTAAICTALAVSRASGHRHRVALTAPPRAQNTAGTVSARFAGK